MKKYLLFPVTYLLLSLTSAAQILKNNLKEMNLKGMVKTITERSYKAIEESGKIQKGERTGNIIIYFFNKNGNMIKKDWYYSLDYQSRKDTCLYDSKGNLIEMDWYYINDGKLEKKFIYKYDSTQKLIEKYTYNPDGSSDGRSVFKYARYRNMIDELIYDKYGDRNESNNFKYDSLWNLTEEFHSVGQHYRYTYDSDRNITEKINARDEHIPNAVIYSYTFLYEYDKNLNWIKKSEFTNGKPTSITERLIEYF